MSFTEFDIQAYLLHIGVQYWLPGSPNVGNGWVGIRCIYCNDHHNHLGINLTYKNFKCWLCGAGGGLLTFIQDVENVGYGPAVRRVEEFESDIPFEFEERKRSSIKGVDILPPYCMGELTNTQRQYLIGRRFDPDALVDKWGLLGGPITGDWQYRIIIPVHLKGEIVTWIGMDATGQNPVKYRAAPVEESYVPVSEVVYGADHVHGTALIVEGPTDVWRMGFGAVALLGMETSESKIKSLLALDADQYYVMLDAEPEAQRRAFRLAHTLSKHQRKVELLKLVSGDPAELSIEEATNFRLELGLESV